MSEFYTHKVDGLTVLEAHTWIDIQKETAKHRRSRIVVESYSEAKQMSVQQIRFWKGVLLPQLSKSSGDSVAWWENHLKLNVMPEDFKPIEVDVDGDLFKYLPPITALSIKKANQLVEGSVDYLRNKCGMEWVMLPDKLKRR